MSRNKNSTKEEASGKRNNKETTMIPEGYSKSSIQSLLLETWIQFAI
jgi:hypothetical protein